MLLGLIKDIKKCYPVKTLVLQNAVTATHHREIIFKL